MKSILLSILALTLSWAAWSQANYKKATVITNNAEKLHGWINYKEWDGNPAVISFKTNSDQGKATKYTVRDIRYFEIEGMEYYERFPVTISMDKRAPVSELSHGADNRTIRDTVMLKIIQKGKSVDLFSYRDGIKIRYYLKEHDAEIPVELIYKRYLQPENNSRIKTAETFKNQLLETSRKIAGVNAPEILKYIMASSYSEKDMARIARMMNKGSVQRFAIHKPSPVHVYAGLAFSSSRAAYEGTNPLTTGAANKTSNFPKLTLGMDVLNNPFIGRLIFKFDLSLTGANYAISKTTDEQYVTTHTFRQYTGSISALVLYNLYNTDRFKLNLGAGFSANVSKYDHNKVQIDDLKHPDWGRTEERKLRGLWVALPVRVSAVVQKKVEIYAQYNYPFSSISDYVYYAIHINSFQVGFNYFF